jgi:hypothetical protein|eukprot:COSAG03_NODE_828_length_5708_cov_537.017828_3_plen_74_part_00
MLAIEAIKSQPGWGRCRYPPCGNARSWDLTSSALMAVCGSLRSLAPANGSATAPVPRESQSTSECRALHPHYY